MTTNFTIDYDGQRIPVAVDDTWTSDQGGTYCAVHTVDSSKPFIANAKDYGFLNGDRRPVRVNWTIVHISQIHIPVELSPVTMGEPQPVAAAA